MDDSGGDDDDAGAFEPPDEVVVPIEDWIDLHPFRPRDIKDVVESYLEEALAAGFAEVRLVHGRGIGAQRATVRKLLARHPRVRDFGDAPAGQGGWGATIARLSVAGDPDPQAGDAD